MNDQEREEYERHEKRAEKAFSWFMAGTFTLLGIIVVGMVIGISLEIFHHVGIVRPLAVVGAFLAAVYVVKQVGDRRGWWP